ncbi:ketosteroid isomerase-like protein [Paraburkholderia sp. BL23I1N1]|uniref:nuclear transport factor 2 family protein n=1 Tax=Paraburkholderia sp. BL23I1N1 TaxID=1938802 RepID=UPI000E75C2B6|nr:nuclear transport factor 2 family protein [Paraburkholderia sp. BL23I1N1]RKE36427.1 ketosteroid isomerase-like protein [Paraburkholderia sp. BL23I1N1]
MTQNHYELAVEWTQLLASPDSDAFVAIFEEDGAYIDPIIGIERLGKAQVRLHHQRWHAAVSNCKITVENVVVGDTSAAAQYLCVGVFDGEPLGPAENPVRPTGKPFSGRCAVILEISPAGKIKSCTEYYDLLQIPCGNPPPFRKERF